ncbi:MSHA biogenesis protein MshF [Vibrio pectenicida]|uniref:MSHA biogenesis protein MshF n=1 Tax=Vibrio pectenicida TaxID=62763 RepID=UPI001C1034A9|nr:MSHA biogenesis protein MshF [Vibrio pectenicida]
MLFRANIAMDPDRSRLVIWLVAISILLLSLLSVVEKLQADMNETAFLLASKRMIERAGFYKQQWVLKGQPEQLEIEGQQIIFSSSGWVLPIGDKSISSCQFWFALLYPEQRVLDESPVRVVEHSELDNYRCNYIFAQGNQIQVQLVESKFSVDTDND